MAQSIYRDQQVSGDVLQTIEFLGKDGVNVILGARIRAVVDGTPSVGKMPTKFEIWTVNSSGVETLAFTLSAAQLATFAGAQTMTGILTPTGGIAPPTAPHGFRNFPPAAATDGTDTAFADGTLFLTSVFVPVNKTLTGIGFLLGSVGGTDKVVVQLNDSAGLLLANSTLVASGTTAGTAAQTQSIAFTSTYAAKGPATYFIGVSANGLTAKLRTVPAFRAPELFCGSVSQVAATPATVVAPSAFAADKAPIAFVY